MTPLKYHYNSNYSYLTAFQVREKALGEDSTAVNELAIYDQALLAQRMPQKYGESMEYY